MIIGAQINYNGKEYRLPRPNRHHNVIDMIHNDIGDTGIFGEQGFYTRDGFLGRKDGAKYAIECGQIEKLNWPPNLFSEDLW